MGIFNNTIAKVKLLLGANEVDAQHPLPVTDADVKAAVEHLATQDARGLIANRPLANSVPPGSTYWAVDRLGQSDEVTVSDGTNWSDL